MPTSPTPIAALPTPPSRDDSANFATRGDAFLGALPTFRTETNAVATNVYNNAVEADADAVAAAASALAAANSASAANASAQAAAIATNISGWVSGTSYTVGQAVYSPITFLTYRRITNGAGTTDPSADATNWQLISGTVTSVAVSGGTTGLTTSGGPVSTTGTITLAGILGAANGGTGVSAVGASGNVLTSDGSTWVSAAPPGLPQLSVATSTSVTAQAGFHYVLTNASTTTVTLPASPTAGNAVWVTVANGRIDNVIARNGQNINSLAENMTIDNSTAGVQLRFADSTRGWVFS